MPIEPKALSGRPPYEGAERRLAIAIDVGTTYSAVSYCIFDPGLVPQITPVTTFGGERVGDVKIPTIVYYDPDGELCGVGRKSVFDHLQRKVDEDDVTKVEWFKVHLRPKRLEQNDEEFSVNPIPFGKTVVQVLGDFLGFMYQAAKEFIINMHPNGNSLWTSFEDRVHFVLTHPNGYEADEQGLMRQAAIEGGLVLDDKTARERVKLVTEGEASLHYCLDQGLAVDEVWKYNSAVMIVDAGGGTVDFSTFWKSGLIFEETTATRCMYNGSIFVTRRAYLAIRDKLSGTKYAGDVPAIMEVFDDTVKHQFDSDDELYPIPFAGRQENDPALGIRSGKLRLEGSQVAAFFQPAIDAIRTAILDQVKASIKEIRTVFLVGGFAESRWLFEHLKADPELSNAGLDICRPGSGHRSKAVSNGALSWYIDRKVTTRVAKLDYGIRCSYKYNPQSTLHQKRGHLKFTDKEGDERLPGGFKRILPKGTQVSETTEFKEQFCIEADDPSNLRDFSVQLWSYHGKNPYPMFLDDDTRQYQPVWAIKCDLTDACRTLKKRMSADGEEFFVLYIRVILLFGWSEFKAQVAWTEKGAEKRSDAVVVPAFRQALLPAVTPPSHSTVLPAVFR